MDKNQEVLVRLLESIQSEIDYFEKYFESHPDDRFTELWMAVSNGLSNLYEEKMIALAKLNNEPTYVHWDLVD